MKDVVDRFAAIAAKAAVLEIDEPVSPRHPGLPPIPSLAPLTGHRAVMVSDTPEGDALCRRWDLLVGDLA